MNLNFILFQNESKKRLVGMQMHYRFPCAGAVAGACADFPRGLR
jgi:hypothetical protein